MKESLREVGPGADLREAVDEEGDPEVESEDEFDAQGVIPGAEDLAVDLEDRGFSIRNLA